MSEGHRYDVEVHLPAGLDEQAMRTWLEEFADDVARIDQLRVTLDHDWSSDVDSPPSRLPSVDDPGVGGGVHFTFKLCSARLSPQRGLLFGHIQFLPDSSPPSSSGPE